MFYAGKEEFPEAGIDYMLALYDDIEFIDITTAGAPKDVAYNGPQIKVLCLILELVDWCLFATRI